MIENFTLLGQGTVLVQLYFSLFNCDTQKFVDYNVFLPHKSQGSPDASG